MKPNILVICGPTASGKTALAVALAKALDGEVVSADSMQVYRRMDIGTAKPTAEEMDGVPHHMIDVADPEENYSVARYVQDGCAAVDDILARGKLPIVAGGTGLYIDNLVAGRSFAPLPEEGAIRRELQTRARAEGLPVLLEELRRVAMDALDRCRDRNIRDWSSIKGEIKGDLSGYLYKKTKRNPMILPVIMEV